MSDRGQTVALFLNVVDDRLMEYVQRGVRGEGVRVLRPPDPERASLMAMVPEADVLIGWGSDPELLAAAARARLFINPGAGISQHIANFRGLERGRRLVLANGHGNAYAVAQHTVALTLALANKVVPYHQRMVDGVGRGGGARTLYFSGITVGLLGYGAINRHVHRFLRGFDVRFAACRYAWGEDRDPLATEVARYSRGDLEGFFTASDVVIMALPTTAATRGLVTRTELRLLGEQGLLVNVGRAASLVQEDVFAALVDREIAGAAFDVWWGRDRDRSGPEPCRRDPYALPFHTLSNVVMSPHRGADSGGDMKRWDEVIENIRRVRAGRTDFLNVVDLAREY